MIIYHFRINFNSFMNFLTTQNIIKVFYYIQLFILNHNSESWRVFFNNDLININLTDIKNILA